MQVYLGTTESHAVWGLQPVKGAGQDMHRNVRLGCSQLPARSSRESKSVRQVQSDGLGREPDKARKTVHPFTDGDTLRPGPAEGGKSVDGCNEWERKSRACRRAAGVPLRKASLTD